MSTETFPITIVVRADRTMKVPGLPPGYAIPGLTPAMSAYVVKNGWSQLAKDAFSAIKMKGLVKGTPEYETALDSSYALAEKKVAAVIAGTSRVRTAKAAPDRLEKMMFHLAEMMILNHPKFVGANAKLIKEYAEKYAPSYRDRAIAALKEQDELEVPDIKLPGEEDELPDPDAESEDDDAAE